MKRAPLTSGRFRGSESFEPGGRVWRYGGPPPCLPPRVRCLPLPAVDRRRRHSPCRSDVKRAANSNSRRRFRPTPLPVRRCVGVGSGRPTMGSEGGPPPLPPTAAARTGRGRGRSGSTRLAIRDHYQPGKCVRAEPYRHGRRFALHSIRSVEWPSLRRAHAPGKLLPTAMCLNVS